MMYVLGYLLIGIAASCWRSWCEFRFFNTTNKWDQEFSMVQVAYVVFWPIALPIGVGRVLAVKGWQFEQAQKKLEAARRKAEAEVDRLLESM